MIEFTLFEWGIIWFMYGLLMLAVGAFGMMTLIDWLNGVAKKEWENHG